MDLLSLLMSAHKTKCWHLTKNLNSKQKNAYLLAVITHFRERRTQQSHSLKLLRWFRLPVTVSRWMTASTGAMGLNGVIQAQAEEARLSQARCIVLLFFFRFSLLRLSCLPADMSHQGCRQECTPARLPDVHCSVKTSRTRGANVQRSPRPWFSKHAEQMRDKPETKMFECAQSCFFSSR